MQYKFLDSPQQNAHKYLHILEQKSGIVSLESQKVTRIQTLKQFISKNN